MRSESCTSAGSMPCAGSAEVLRVFPGVFRQTHHWGNARTNPKCKMQSLHYRVASRWERVQEVDHCSGRDSISLAFLSDCWCQLAAEGQPPCTLA
jgi:hypothetical protein